jgi:hypothetical protein
MTCSIPAPKAQLEVALSMIGEIADAMDVIGQSMRDPDGAPFLAFAHALQDQHQVAEKAFNAIIGGKE